MQSIQIGTNPEKHSHIWWRGKSIDVKSNSFAISIRNFVLFTSLFWFSLFYWLQTTALGIQFDYKKEHRRLWQFNLVCIVLLLLSLASTYDAYLFSRRFHMANDFIDFYVPACLENFVVAQISITFATLLRCLHVRFAMLNKRLRYFHILNQVFSMHRTFDQIWFCFCFAWKRNRFLTENNTLKMWVRMRKRDAIDTIKLIGRQHAFLTGTMDNINFCFSFQV